MHYSYVYTPPSLVNLKYSKKGGVIKMGIIKDFMNFRKNVKQFNNFIGDRLRSEIGNRWSDPPIRNTEQWLEMFEENPRFNPVHKIATTMSMLEHEYVNEQDVITETILADFFKNRNTMFTFSQLIYLTSAWLDIIGECGWIIERGARGIPIQAYPIPPHWVQEIPSQDSEFFCINLSEDKATRYSVPQEDFIYFRNPKLINPYTRGFGHTQAIGDEIEIDEYMSKYNKRFFYNDATPSLLIIADGANKADRERLRQEWKSKYQGGINAYEPAFFSQDLRVEILKQSMKEMDFIESRRYIRNSNIEHYGIPKEIFGITENANRSTIDVAEYLYMKYVIRPRATNIQQAINNQLLPNFNLAGMFQFVNIVPEDQERILTKTNAGFDRGTITIDEWRQENGYEPLENSRGNVRRVSPFELPLNQDPNDRVMVIDDSQNVQDLPEPETRSIKKTHLNFEQKVAYVFKQLGRRADAVVRRYEARLADYFDAQREEVMENLSGAISRGYKDLTHDTKFKRITHKYIDCDEVLEKFYDFDEPELFMDFIFDLEQKNIDHDILNCTHLPYQVLVYEERPLKSVAVVTKQNFSILDLINWVAQENGLSEILEELWVDAARTGFIISDDLFDFGIDFDIDVQPEVLEAVQEFGARRITGINATTMDEVNAQIVAGLREGESIDLIQARLANLYADFSSNRARTIARTEVQTAVNVGTFETYSSANVETKEWITNLDGRQRSSHDAMNGQQRPLNEPFISGDGNPLMFPGDPNSLVAAEVIHCRCTMIAVVEA